MGNGDATFKLRLYFLPAAVEDLYLYRRYIYIYIYIYIYEDKNILGTRYSVFLNATVGVR